MMDGGYENLEINLRQVMFWPDNILQLFQRFGVKKQFDLLSVDMDSYDWFMLEKILDGGYKPRVIIMEFNANLYVILLIPRASCHQRFHTGQGYAHKCDPQHRPMAVISLESVGKNER